MGGILSWDLLLLSLGISNDSGEKLIESKWIEFLLKMLSSENWV